MMLITALSTSWQLAPHARPAGLNLKPMMLSQAESPLDKLRQNLQQQVERVAAEGGDDADGWFETASLMRDAASDLAASDLAQGDHLAVARDLISTLVAESSRIPRLHALTKLAAKKNGNLALRRSCERCVAELGILVGTCAALSPTEREELICAARPISQTAPTAARLRAMFVLCRGFFTPGSGKGAHGWRRGRGTVHQLLVAAAANGSMPTFSTSKAFDATLAAASEPIRQHSRVLRAAFSLLDRPLQLWLSEIDARGLAPPPLAYLPTDATAFQGEAATGAAFTERPSAAHLLLPLIEAGGDEGARLAQALGRWVVDCLIESFDPRAGPHAASASVLAKAHGSDVARLLHASHASLVRGSGRQQKRWLAAVDRIGHAVWLMAMAASDARVEAHGEAADVKAAGGPTSSGLGEGASNRGRVSAKDEGSLVIERVRAVMLSCTLLEASDELRPKYRAAMSRAHTTPSRLWQLMATALALQVGAAADVEGSEPLLAHSDADDRGPPRGPSAREHAREPQLDDEPADDGPTARPPPTRQWSEAQVAAATSQLLSWPRPELVFKYLQMHRDDDEIGPVAQRWVVSLLGLSDERLTSLRCTSEGPTTSSHRPYRRVISLGSPLSRTHAPESRCTHSWPVSSMSPPSLCPPAGAPPRAMAAILSGWRRAARAGGEPSSCGWRRMSVLARSVWTTTMTTVEATTMMTCPRAEWWLRA